MKRHVKRLLAARAPELLGRLQALQARRYSGRLEREQGLRHVARRLADAHGPIVLSGPFRGLRYTRRALDGHTAPKLLGSYEAELHPALDRLLAQPFRQIVDVGTAEGYYAVGLATRLPGARVVGYELDPRKRRICREMAAHNGAADRVDVRGRCTVEGLREVLEPDALVFCDCEGYERELLDPQRVPRLTSATLVVELHDRLSPGVTEALAARFRPSHRVDLLGCEKRDPRVYSALNALTPEERGRALDEYRDLDQRWAVMTPRTTANA